MHATPYDQGFTKGLRQGRKEAKRELVQEQLEARFGLLSEAVRERLRGLSGKRLMVLTKALLTAASLRELGLEE